MNNVASHRTLAAVAFATVACLMLFAVVLVQPLEATQQQSTSEEEVAAKVKAELEAKLAEMTHRLQERFAELEAIGELDIEKMKQAMEAMNLEQEHLEQALEERLQAAQLHSNEAMHRAQEAQVRAMQTAERAIQRARTTGISVGRGGCEVYGESVLEFTEDLELADDQSDQIRAVQRDTRRAGIERRADIEVAKMDLEALYEADQPDLTAIRSQLEMLAMLDVDNQIAGLTLRQQVREILTPAQLETLDDMRKTDETRSFVVYNRGAGGNRTIRLGGFDCWR